MQQTKTEQRNNSSYSNSEHLSGGGNSIEQHVEMIVKSVRHYVDDRGNPIDVIEVQDSKYERIELHEIPEKRRLICVGITQSGSKDREVFEFQDELYRGVKPLNQERRDVDDDFQDSLNVVGFAAIAKTEEP